MKRFLKKLRSKKVEVPLKTTFSDTEKYYLLKDFQTLNSLSKWMHEKVNKPEFEETFKDKEELEKELSLLELLSGDILAKFNYSSDLNSGLEEQFKELRNANETISALEKQLEEGVSLKLSNENTINRINQLYKSVHNWWMEDGFHYMHEENFSLDANGFLSVKFGFMLSDVPSMISTDRESEEKERKAHVQKLREEGFVFLEDDTSSAPVLFRLQLTDCEGNRERLIRKIKRKYPSFRFTHFDIQTVSDFSYIDGINGKITELEDIF